MSFTNFTTGHSHNFGGEYLELVPNERLRYSDRFDDPNLPGEIIVTVTMKPVLVGTELNIEQAGIPEAIPLEALSRLAGVAAQPRAAGRTGNQPVVSTLVHSKHLAGFDRRKESNDEEEHDLPVVRP